jgi:hypothetical protein
MDDKHFDLLFEGEAQKKLPQLHKFDLVKALSPTMKEWINANFPLLLNEMEGKSEPGKIDARISCSKWWYFREGTLPAEHEVPSTAASHGMGSPDDANLQRIANQNLPRIMIIGQNW